MQTGDTFPDFTLPRDGGSTISLADFKGQKLVIYFYPKDDTPGCTLEGIEFTAALPEFTAAGAAVVGISRDSVQKHDKFVAKYNLGMPLLADEDGTLSDSLGIWVKKSNFGRAYMGLERTTYLLDEAGVIRQIWPKVRVKGHVAKVLAAVTTL